MKLSQSTIEHLLDTWPVARLATTKPGGHLHQVPVVFVYHAGQLWWLRIDVEIRVIRLMDNHEDTLHRDLTGVVEALRLKCPQYHGTAVLREPPTLLAMRPLRFSSWTVASVHGE